MNYRVDINGLRAIAVIAVVLFHFNPTWIPGGFAGVDVFFVISGFLMTGIIFKGLENNSFSLFKFYVARANRIIPALAVLCLVLLIFGWFYLTPVGYKALGKHVASSVTFLSNVIYWKETGYFDAASHEKWLLHTWSLSAEWQFYILYPIALIIFQRFLPLKQIKVLIILGTFLGFIASVYASFKWPDPAYYLLPTRAWEMMLGGVAYLFPLTIKDVNKKWCEWTGIGLICTSYVFISKDDLWPGYLALLPVMGAYLVIISNRNNSIITNNSIFQNIGKWSYSIYLWHWPLVVLGYYFAIENWLIIGLPLSIILGWLSYKFIESINLTSFTLWNDLLFVKPIWIVLIVGGLSSLLYNQDGIDNNIRRGAENPKDKFLNKYEIAQRNLEDAYWLKCNTYNSLSIKNTLQTDPICITKKGAGGVFLWGDSHAEALSLGIRELLEPLKVPFYQKTSSACKARINESLQKGLFKEACDHSNNLAIESIKKLKPQLVVIAQANQHDTSDFISIYKKIKSFGINNVLVIGPISQWQPSLPKVMIKPSHWGTRENYIYDVGLDINIINSDIKMEGIPFPKGLYYKSLIHDLCMKNGDKYYCRVNANENSLLQVDYGHLSKDGSRFIANNLLKEEILKLLTLSNNSS